MADEERSTPSPSTSRPFFDIAPEGTASDSPPASVMFGTEAPSAIQVGTLGAPMADGMATVPQLTGQVSGSLTPANGAFGFQPVELKRSGSGGVGQFFLGMFLPYLVFMAMAFTAFLVEPSYEDMPDFYRSETHDVVPQGDGWYTVGVEKTEMESFDFWLVVVPTEGDDAEYSVSYDPLNTYWDRNGAVVEWTYNESSRESQDRVVGEYHAANSTVAFQPVEGEMPTEVWVNYHDYRAEEAWWDENDGGTIINTLDLCFGISPLAYLVGVVAAFVKGKKMLGAGLLCAIPAGIVMVPLLFVGTLILFGY